MRYLLQRKLVTEGDNAWQWLMVADAEPAAIDDPLNEDIVSQTITGTGNSATVTWENLPDCNEDGTDYEYRVVEQVPGSYDVEGGTEVAKATDKASGVTYRFYVVTSTDADDDGSVDTQEFIERPGAPRRSPERRYGTTPRRRLPTTSPRTTCLRWCSIVPS